MIPPEETRTMDRQGMLRLLEGLLEEPTGSLQGMEPLASLAGWSSLTALGFLVLSDEKFSVVPTPDALAEARTVNDLLAFWEKSDRARRAA